MASLAKKGTPFGRNLACEQAHLFGEFARDNFGSEPARGMSRGKVSLHESH